MEGPNELKLELSESLKKAFKDATKGRKDVPESVLKCMKNGDYVGVDEMRWLYRNKKEGVWLCDVLSGTELILPEPVIPPRNPELEARCRKLRAQQEDREYRKMTKNVDPVRVHHPEDTMRYQLNAMNRQMIAVFQFVVSVGAGFTFGFYGIQLMTGPLDFGFRLLLGIIASLVIALAEIYFLAKKLADDMDFPDFPKSKTE
ncbi:hypothetical protein GE061_011342 [Apolygus lucorum]|uniref:Uncharacterized protein n=1 Tax=Apolygus lucorum TaxID=248454 RepID=A0A6A4K0Q1_APOLU|nr:hypothetical protein GE061_011342 [Apolygus lucorum]